MIRAALLTREFPPEVYGGAGAHVEHLSQALCGHVDVSVHCFGAARSSPLVAATYEPWDQLPGGPPVGYGLRAMSVDLAMAAGCAGSDVVHSHTWYTNLGGHLAKLINGIPHVVTTHSLEPRRPWKVEQLGGGIALSGFSERTALEGADAIIAVSHAMRDDILSCYPAVAPERVRVVPNGIDTAEYGPDDRTDALERHGADPARPYVLFVGRMTRQKGIGHLLAAAPLIDRSARLVLCAGPADTPMLSEEVRGQIARAEDRILCVEGFLPRHDIVQLLTHCAVSVCPSIYEPFGLVNLEAMACAAPVVASAVGGIPEVVVEGETGLLVPLDGDPHGGGAPRDPARFAADLASAINSLLADPARARRMGEAGRRRVAEEFTWTAVAQRTVDVYRQVLDAPATTPLAPASSFPGPG